MQHSDHRNRLHYLLIFGIGMLATTVTAAELQNSELSFKGEQAISVSQELMAQGRVKEALDSAEEATRTDPKSGIAFANKALILDKMNKTQKANQAYEKALKLSPENGYVLNAVANNFCLRGKAVESDALFVRAVQDLNYPIPQQALQNAGICAYKAGNHELAEKRFRSALTVNPQAGQSLESLSEIKFKQSKFFEARAFMQRREALGPLGVDMLKLAQQIEKSAGDDRAAAQYQKQLDLVLQAQIQPPTGEGQKKP